MSQRDGRDLARRLLRRADADVTLVRRVIDDADIADAIIGFHAQQTVEKSIKAVLAAHEIKYGKTHQLHYLIRLLEENEIDAPSSVVDAVELNPWAVESATRRTTSHRSTAMPRSPSSTRYGAGPARPSSTDVRAAVVRY